MKEKNSDTTFTAEAVNEYVRCFNNPDAIHAMCEDYRAGASIDLTHDEQDYTNKITCPHLALRSATGYVGRTQNVIDVWKEYSENVTGHSLTCGHYIAEELPQETYEAVNNFLSR